MKISVGYKIADIQRRNVVVRAFSQYQFNVYLVLDNGEYMMVRIEDARMAVQKQVEKQLMEKLFTSIKFMLEYRKRSIESSSSFLERCEYLKNKYESIGLQGNVEIIQ